MELPTISGAAYSTSVVEPMFDQMPPAPKQNDQAEQFAKMLQAQNRGMQNDAPEAVRRMQHDPLKNLNIPLKEQPVMASVRIVKVFVADTDERLPLEKRILFTGPEQLTDLNDQELFFEVPIAELLKTHNVYRVQHIDKKASAKGTCEVFLEPVRIRDLKMVVVTLASF